MKCRDFQLCGGWVLWTHIILKKKKSVIYNEKERKIRHKDQAKWPQIFFPLLVISQTQQW